jgi:hypothetical protein
MGAIAMATLALDYTIISNPAAVDGGVDHTAASKINNHGEVGGFYTLPDDSIHGFYWHNGEFVDIAAPGVDTTEVFGLNDAGELAGMVFPPAAPPAAFVYSAGTFLPLTIPGAFLTAAQDINNAPAVVGVFQDATGTHGFVFSESGGLIQLDAPDASQTVAFGINDQGIVVGSYQTADESHGFVWDGTNFFDVDVPGAATTFVQDINDWGQMAGFYVDNNGNSHGFVFAEGNFFTIEAPGGLGAIPGTVQVSGINNLGQVVGNYATDGLEGTESFVTTLGMEFTYDVTFFDHPDAVPSGGPPASFGTEIRNSNVDGDFVGRYSDSASPAFSGQSFANFGGTLFDLGFEDATGGVAASDINDLDQIVGTYFVTEDSTVHGFIFDGDDFVTLDSTLGDAGTTELLGMNNIGQIVGTYTDGGAEHAFVYDSINGFVELDLTGAGAVGNNIIALDVNDFGQIVGTYVDVGTGIRHGFLLKDGVFTTIAHPDAAGFGSGGVSINNAGQIAGFYMDSTLTVNAFVYSGGVYSTVGMPNSGGAYGISNSGVVSGSDNDGTTHSGFMAEISGATLVPTVLPSTEVIAWDNPVDGDFNDATKWMGGVVPGETDRAVITRAGEYTVTLTSDHTVGQIAVGNLDNDDVTLRIVDAVLQVDGGRIIAPGTIELDSDSAAGAALLIGADTVIKGGCGCEADILMGTTDPVGAIQIGTADGLADVARLVNSSAWIAGQGQIGDAMMKLVNGGLIEAMGGTLVLDTGATRIVNRGFLESGPDSTLDVDSAINNFGEITASGAGGAALLGSPLGGAINLNGSVKNFAFITAEEGGSINVTGALKNYGLIDIDGSFSASGSVLNEFGGIQASGSGLIDITGNVVNKGGITAYDDSSILLHGAVNNAAGTLTADGGLILVGSTSGAAGLAEIVDDGTIHFEGAARAHVGFSGDEGGTLILDDATTFKGDITGFDDTDMIQFKDLLFGSDVEFRYIESQNLLKIFENGVLDSKLYFDGSYTDADFQMIDDGTGRVAIQHFEPPII